MFDRALRDAQSRVQSCLDTNLAQYEGVIGDAMRYTCSGGKRIRAFLVLEGGYLHGVVPEQTDHAAAAIEAIHAYSLVHDDLPCMDNDDLRRGKPTVHKKWDDATAVLTGDALQSFAFGLLASQKTSDDPAVRLQLISGLATAAGAKGMVLGQALDIAAETAETALTLNEITTLQAGKTGALIEWAAEAGPILAKADPGPMRGYARALGLAFQIADDILDTVGDADKAGKRLQKDAEAGKATFVSLLGLEGATRKAQDLVSEANANLDVYGDAAENLRSLARFVIEREM